MCVRMEPESSKQKQLYQSVCVLCVQMVWLGHYESVLTSTQLFKYQIKAGVVFKELDQFQNVPGSRYGFIISIQ